MPGRVIDTYRGGHIREIAANIHAAAEARLGSALKLLDGQFADGDILAAQRALDGLSPRR